MKTPGDQPGVPLRDLTGIFQPQPTVSITVEPIDEKTWIEWRCKLGCRKAEAKALYREYTSLLRDEPGTVRMVKPRHGESFDSALRAFIDSMPRRPTRFLAMVAESERLRAIRAQIAERKLVGKARYLRRFNKCAHSAEAGP